VGNAAELVAVALTDPPERTLEDPRLLDVAKLASVEREEDWV